MTDQLINHGIVAFATFFATVGPIDVAAMFAALTLANSVPERRATAVKATLVASGILLMFALAGRALLDYMGITFAALQTSGGLLLLLIGIDMVLAKHSGITSTTDEEEMEAARSPDVAVFPIALPLIAGPGAIGAVILLMGGAEGDLPRQGAVLAALGAVLLITFIAMLVATQIQRLLGVTGLNVITRVMGVLLTALAVQFIFNGLANSGLFS